MGVDIQQCESEILKGLQNETERLDAAKTNLAVYSGTFADPELSYYDRDGRARRDLPLMRKVIDALTCYAYQAAPTRHFEDNVATDLLAKVYAQTRANTLLAASDRYRHASNYFAVQVHATGDVEKPVRMIGWTADTIVVWTDPEDQTLPVAVCTIDRYDQQTRYRLWTDSEVRTYVTAKWNGETSGGRVPRLISAETNPYGVLPFIFQHLLPPITQFDEGGIGGLLSTVERNINFRLLENADHLRFSKPRGFLLGLEAGKDLISRPRAGEWDRFPAIPPSDARETAASLPDVRWIGPPLEWVDKDWDDLRYYWNWMLECVGVPASSIPLDKAVIATVSGAALIARQIPLFTYARKTQEQYRSYEQELAKLVMTVSNKIYGTALPDDELTITWGEVVPDMPPDSPDDYLDGLADRGELSEVQVIQKRFSLSREQALAHIEQVAQDQADIAKIRAKYGVTATPAPQPLENITVANEEV